jgi:N-acyl-D-amino-acid deacylase
MKILRLISLLTTCVLMIQCTGNRYDIVIMNGTIYDGEGKPSVKANIGITGGIITKIDGNISAKGAVVIDAGNMIVAPGFIDIHTHCDGQVLREGMNSVENYLTQGVTTVVTGNCGGGTFEVERFYRRLDSIGTGTNFVHLVGHNTIRSKVMGMDDRAPTEEELAEMKKLVKKGMEEGAAGFSTGLFYTPGAYSLTAEVIELVKVVKDFDGFYATHLRDESNYTVGLEDAVREALEIGEQTGVRVEIAHIKALGKPVWGMAERICTLIEDARERGVHVFADQYPYNASSTGLSGAVVPAWVRAGGDMKARLENPELLPGIKTEIAENIERRGGPESLVIISHRANQAFEGKNLMEISSMINKTPVETAIWLVLEGSPGIVSFNMNDADVAFFMKKDYVMTSSDGNIEAPGNGKPHPRSYGAFTRKIRKFVLEDKLLTMEQAIRAATSMPADMIGISDRGRIKEGHVADIVIFDPETIGDAATFNEPHQYSTGISYLLIDGIMVIEQGKYNGKLAGKPLPLKGI